MSWKQRRALKELKKMQSVVILPADIENSTVILSQDDYHYQLAEMLDCDSYRWLNG